MIIYGSRMYGKKNVVPGWGYCEQCGVYGKNESYNGRKWGHLYFIPLIPESPHVRVMHECKKCSFGRHIPEKDIPEILEGIRRASRSAMDALLAGEKQFEKEKGDKTNCIAHLAESVKLLHGLNAQEDMQKISAALQEHNLAYAEKIVAGQLLELQGNLTEAAEAYMEAAKNDPSDTAALMALGSVHVMKKDLAGARAIYEKALELHSEADSSGVRLVLLHIYKSQKDHAKVAETYERLLALMPELKTNKKVMKEYRQACKKAGRQGLA